MRLRAAVLAVPAAVVLVGCGSSNDTATPAPTTPEVTSAPSVAPSTTVATRPTTPHVAPVVTRDGECPYFSTQFAQDTVGQHIARSTVVTTSPYHGCVLYRPDNGKAVEVQVTIFATPVVAEQKAVTGLGAGANPVKDIGDRATVLVGTDGTRLLASKGRYLINVWINQQSSLQAHDIAAKVVARIR